MVTDAAYFDQWYADIDRSPRRRELFAGDSVAAAVELGRVRTR